MHSSLKPKLPMDLATAPTLPSFCGSTSTTRKLTISSASKVFNKLQYLTFDSMAWTAAVKIAYEGEEFMGSQRQPEERTVEGEVLRTLLKLKAVESAKDSR